MTRIEALKKATLKRELANVLGVKASFLTHTLYHIKPENQYSTFTIPKKSGGERTIHAPIGQLKSLQSSLSILLLDCIDEINKVKFPDSQANNPKNKDSIFKGEDGEVIKVKDPQAEILKVKVNSTRVKQPSLSHGFVRKRSIITNAMMHLNQRNVLNIDLANFFDSFNFGRVRGFFIKNDNFNLDPAVATVIAQIACYENKLPQGSPCSPVITNLITHSLDIRLASLAEKNSCIYSRYADDITFSTRKNIFPKQVMRQENGEYIPAKRLRREIERAGFLINSKKTRIQYKDSRQDVTGLVVNEKPNVKNEYWRAVRTQCHRLFHTGSFFKKAGDKTIDGNIHELEGQLNFIDQLDSYNRLREKEPLNPTYELSKHGYKTNTLLSGREKTFSQFLYYRLFYGNTKPTILCEGKTDNVYLKSALSRLFLDYPELVQAKTATDPYKLLVGFMEYSKRTRFLLELYGGASYLNFFIGKFDKHFKFYNAPRPEHPVILILDNDSGFVGKSGKGIEGKLKKIATATSYPTTLEKNDFRNTDFIHVVHNLYIVLTPLKSGKDSDIEDLFDSETKQRKVSGKSFNSLDNRDNKTEYGKEIFAHKVIKAKKGEISFDGLRPLLSGVVKAINHYNSLK